MKGANMITLLCKHTHKQIKHPPILLPIITWAYMCKENMYVYLKIARVLMNKKKTAQRYTPGCQHFEWQRRTGRGTWERRDQIWLCTCFCCILHSLPKKRYLLLKMKKKNNKQKHFSKVKLQKQEIIMEVRHGKSASKYMRYMFSILWCTGWGVGN